MDALKRAEEAKRQSGTAGPESAGNGRELSLEPQGGSESPLPDLNSHLAAVDADLQAEANAPGAALPGAGVAATGTVAKETKERQAAKNVFAAKQPPAPLSPGGKSTLALAIGGGVVALGIVGYFGYQYLTLTGVIQRPPAAAKARPSGSDRAVGLSAAKGALRTPAEASSSLADESDSAGAQLPPALPPTTGSAKNSTRQLRPPTPTASTARPGAAGDAASPRDPGVRVATRAPQLPAGLAGAYAALQGGHLADAQAAYTRVLQDDPRNEDALLGLATIAARQGQHERAEGLYIRLLELDPKNAAAHAGLAGIGNYGDPAQRESRLKTLLANPPADGTVTGMLHFALGNLYAEQRRWNEAQQAYFQALTGDDGNPDYLFNLAVSLDHLRQPRLAAQYYEAALAAVGKRTAAFNPQQAEARLATLPR